MRSPEVAFQGELGCFAGVSVYVRRKWYGKWQALTPEGNSRTAWRRWRAIENLRMQYEEIWAQRKRVK